MARWGMVIDLDRCTACQACVVACRAENNVPFAGKEEAEKGRAILWIQLLPMVEERGHTARVRYLPVLCFHCEKPPCTKVCPVGATYLNPEGLVAQIYARCIGCRFCTVACPYTARYFNWYEPKFPETTANYLNPEVFVRPRGVVEKCSFCTQRLRKAKDRARRENRGLRDGEVVPACVQTCPTGAMYFGDLDDPESLVSRMARSPRAFRLLEDLGTEPKVFYLSEGEWHAPAQ